MSGEEVNMTLIFDTKSKEPGDLFYDDEAEDETIFGKHKRPVEVKLSPIYTDYDNIIVFYSCFDTWKHFKTTKNEAVFGFTRKRGFDSLDTFKKAMGPLIQLGVDLNTFRFTYNGKNCD